MVPLLVLLVPLGLVGLGLGELLLRSRSGIRVVRRLARSRVATHGHEAHHDERDGDDGDDDPRDHAGQRTALPATRPTARLVREEWPRKGLDIAFVQRGAGAAGGRLIVAFSASSGVAGIWISPRVGRSRSNVMSTRKLTINAAATIGIGPFPSTDR